MNLKTLYATLAALVVTFLLSWLVYGFLLMDFYEANTTFYEGLMPEMPNMVLVILGSLFWCFLMVFIFQRWAGIKTINGGFKAGLIISFLIMLSYDLSFYSMMNLFNVKLVVVDIIIGTIMGGITGAVIGWVLGFEKKAASSAQ